MYLTNPFVRDIKTKGQQRQVAYTEKIVTGLGLMLVVSYGGSKTWRVLTYRNSKPKTQKLGRYHPQGQVAGPEFLTVAEARAKAREYYENPQKFAAQAAVGSFKEVADNWFKRHVEANRLRSQAEIRRHLEKYIYPKWKDKKFLEIRRGEVNELLDHIVDHHGNSQANAVLATMRHIMGWYQTQNEHYTSPIVPKMKRGKPVARKRTLNENEIRSLWNVCTEVNGTFGALIKVLLLTAQRRDKVTTMRWDDLADGEWTIRVDQREKGTAGKLKLPQMVLDVIEQQPRIVGNPFVFPGRGKGPFNSFSQRKEELDEKLNMEPWVLHDLRRTARSLLSEVGVRPDISERVLGHAIGGVAAIYDRHPYDAEKADALNRLATKVGTFINPPPDNVVAYDASVRRKKKERR